MRVGLCILVFCGCGEKETKSATGGGTSASSAVMSEAVMSESSQSLASSAPSSAAASSSSSSSSSSTSVSTAAPGTIRYLQCVSDGKMTKSQLRWKSRFVKELSKIGNVNAGEPSEAEKSYCAMSKPATVSSWGEYEWVVVRSAKAYDFAVSMTPHAELAYSEEGHAASDRGEMAKLLKALKEDKK